VKSEVKGSMRQFAALTSEQARAALDDLGALRLLRAFKDDWKAAQAHTKQVRGAPLFKGKRAWLAAKARAQKRIQEMSN
jgi:hypothetical protein